MPFDRDAETALVDAFAAANATLIDEIEREVRGTECPDHALDELVLEAAENIAPDDAETASQWASETINNQGFSRQIAFILQENGIADGRPVIAQAALEAAAENTSGITPV